MSAQSYARIGTTPPLFVPKDSSVRSVQPDQDYFFIQVHAAQVAFSGPIWEAAKSVVVTSQVNLYHPNLGNEALRAIQRTRAIRKNQAEQLGMSPNLVSLVPAVMPRLSLSIDFVLDKENRLAALGNLINDNSFLTAVSLAPGAAATARVVGVLAQKVVQTFIPVQESQPILQFSGDFNLADGELKAGYWVIMGTRDPANPLPEPQARLEVINRSLQIEGRPATQISYVVLEVTAVKARSRALNDGALWEGKLREAEDTANLLRGDPFVSDEERKAAYLKSRKLVEEAFTLLRADPNYLRSEANLIAGETLQACRDAIVPSQRTIQERWRPDWQADLAAMGVQAGEDWPNAVAQHSRQAVETLRLVRNSGLY